MVAENNFISIISGAQEKRKKEKELYSLMLKIILLNSATRLGFSLKISTYCFKWLILSPI